ncbi:5-methyltetrahydropteroyltriglutamate--homocysteine methyltransferase [Bienertia sinuspersici]
MGLPRKRGYVTWNSRMDAILTKTLYEQISEGNKADKDFKSQAYQAEIIIHAQERRKDMIMKSSYSLQIYEVSFTLYR